MSVKVNISGVNKVELLRELWTHAKPVAALGNRPAAPAEFDAEEAKRAISAGMINVFCGRCIKTDLSRGTADPRLYDRDAGAGVFAKIVTMVKMESMPDSDVPDLEEEQTAARRFGNIPPGPKVVAPSAAELGDWEEDDFVPPPVFPDMPIADFLTLSFGLKH